MKFKALNFIVLIALSLSASVKVYALEPTCSGMEDLVPQKQIFVPTEADIPPKPDDADRFMQFNVENLFERVGHHEMVEPHKYRLDRARPPKAKADWKLRWIIETMVNVNPDFAVWEEVEDMNAMNVAKEKFGLKGYKPYLLPGNDQRGINIGMWVKEGRYDVKYESNKDVTWYDPVTKRTIPVFSRDVPVMIITEKGQTTPKYILMGTHPKSQRDRDGDPNSAIWRAAQYRAMNDLAKQYRQKYGPDAIILAAGDFNADVRNSPESKEFKGYFTSAFDLAAETNPPNEIITQTYFPPGGAAPVRAQLDDIKFFIGSMVDVIRARVVRYRNNSGIIVGLPQSFEQRQNQPSDHLPIITDVRPRKRSRN